MESQIWPKPLGLATSYTALLHVCPALASRLALLPQYPLLLLLSA